MEEEDDLLHEDRGYKLNGGCCGVGTHEEHFIWCNSRDSTGLICSSLVLIFIFYAVGVVSYGLYAGYVEESNGIPILIFGALAIWSHIKTMCSDPGAVPRCAHPIPSDKGSVSICGRCDAYKPPGSHHDRVSNRCVSRMDHFCPWMNNAIGAKNQKDFFLFLIYTDITAIYMYAYFAIHLVAYGLISGTPYFGTYLNLVRALMFVLLFGIVFTSSMIANQVYGLAIGRGTIDRMKKASELGTPIPFEDVFGSNVISYFLPLDPVFDNPKKVFRYVVKSEPLTSKV